MKAAAFESIQYCQIGKDNFILIFCVCLTKLLNVVVYEILVYFISLCDLDIEILINTLPS